MTHPAVSLAAVIGVPTRTRKSRRSSSSTRRRDDRARLLAWGKEQMAAYKYPRIVEFVTALPMTSTGKILKRELAVR